MRTLLALLLLATCYGWGGQVWAEDYLVYTWRSKHWDAGRKYNERNDGLGFEHRYNENWTALVGFYKNSYDRTAVYGLAAYTPIEIAGWRFGPVFGGVTGYSDGVGPFLAGVAARDFGAFGVNLIFVRSALAVQWKMRIGE